MIFLDNASTTKVSVKACKKMQEFCTLNYFNPSSVYFSGADVKKYIDASRKILLKVLGCSSGEIIFTSGATEANNLAIFGSHRKNFRKMLFSSGEHPSVYNAALELKKKGADVEFIKLASDGEIDFEDLKSKMSKDTDFISVIHVNNETGVINNLKQIYDLKQKICPNAIFHSDGVQALGKIKINLSDCGVDLYSVSAHKIHGPKGVGALFVKNFKKLSPILFGGGQEFNLRSGTENTAGIAGFIEAVQEIDLSHEKIKKLRQEVLKNFPENINGKNIADHIVSLSFEGINGETLVHILEEKEIFISTGSACSSSKVGNRILDSMGRNKNQIKGSIRISFSKYNTLAEVKTACAELKKAVERLKKIR